MKCVYFFGNGKAEGAAAMCDLLGGKGANLADMTLVSLPVPPGFTITTETCAEYNRAGQKPPDGLMEEVRANIAKVEAAAGRKLGDPVNPLLVGVRPGAEIPMPGMMDAVLNIGLNDAIVDGLTKLTGNERFAYDSYRRLISMFGDTVAGVDQEHFERELGEVKNARGRKLDTELSARDLKEVVERYKRVFKSHVGEDFPQDPLAQLERAIEAAFKSWMNQRAARYRELKETRGLRGAAVNVQMMVFGNIGDDSATGTAFTRNVETGENNLYGEFLVNAQGEDVTAGIRTPTSCERMSEWNPNCWQGLLKVKDVLEAHFRAVVDFEFTVERGTPYVLSARPVGKRMHPPALVRAAVEMARAGLIDQETAVFRVDASAIDELMRPVFDPAAPRDVLCRGVPAVPGHATGRVVTTVREAVRRAEREEQVVLAARELGHEDVEGILAAKGVVTAIGGATSHAAVLCRGMAKPCVTGIGLQNFEQAGRSLLIGGRALEPDDWISIDGGTGEVMAGQMPTFVPAPSADLKTLLEWEESHRPRGRPAPAYRGDQPFAFVSYSHNDRVAVFAEMARLAAAGFRLWYDEGIAPSASWPKEIIKALDGCTVVLVFITPSAIASAEVLKEVAVTAKARKTIFPVVMEECELKDEWRYHLAATQMLFKFRLDKADYERGLDRQLKSMGIQRPM